MDEVDSRGPSWVFSQQEEDMWSQKSDTVDTSDLNPSLPGPGLVSHSNFASSTSVDCGFPSLQTSLTASIDSGYPSLQTSAVSLESSFSSFHRSTSLSLSFNEKSVTESVISGVLSPDEGYDDVDSAVDSAMDSAMDSAQKFSYILPGDTAFNHSKLPQTVNPLSYNAQTDSEGSHDTICHTVESLLGSSYYTTQPESVLGSSFYTTQPESVSGSSFYTTQPDEPHVDQSAADLIVRPAELALLLQAGLEKYLLIDSRSFLEYNTSHIQQSANVCCSKLVKRRLQRDKIHIKDFLIQTCHIDMDEFMDVIVYDQCTENRDRLTEDNFLCVLLNKLSCTFNRVALLKDIEDNNRAAPRKNQHSAF